MLAFHLFTSALWSDMYIMIIYKWQTAVTSLMLCESIFWYLISEIDNHRHVPPLDLKSSDKKRLWRMENDGYNISAYNKHSIIQGLTIMDSSAPHRMFDGQIHMWFPLHHLRFGSFSLYCLTTLPVSSVRTLTFVPGVNRSPGIPFIHSWLENSNSVL